MAYTINVRMEVESHIMFTANPSI